MNISIRVKKNNEVFSLLKDDAFVIKWIALAHQMKNLTAFQEPSFVSSWYFEYATAYQPVLVVGYNEQLEIVGILPLAYSLTDELLYHAGTYQAEYHGWICEKHIAHDFLYQALITLKQNFKFNKKWFWGWLPAETETTALMSNQLKKANIHAKVTIEESPVLDLSNFDSIDRMKKSRSLKTKLNRFNKRGHFHIERIKSKEKAIEVFDLLEKQSDFRQMATNQFTPFASDPLRKQFLINRVEDATNCHFTVLWLDNHPIAFNHGECSANTVFLGLVSYDPLEGKNSPGIIFIIKLAELMKEEGYRFFDLTPGGDSYKQTFMNMTQEIPILTIFFDKKDKLLSDFKDALKLNVKNILGSLKIDPTIALRNTTKPFSLIKALIKSSPSQFISQLKSTIYKKEEILFYKVAIDNLKISEIANNISIELNNYSNLFLYETKDQSEKEQVFSNALKRFEKENKIYTLVKEGKLIDYIWVTKKITSHKITPFDMELKLPENSIMLYDTLSNTYSNNLLLKVLEELQKDSKLEKIASVFIELNPQDSSSQEILNAIGFTPYCKLERKKIISLIEKKKVFFEKDL
tara:strand:+ start:570040 stop:571773 length:1734 start_codon:yes stop_codon:yes gene_type:complete